MCWLLLAGIGAGYLFLYNKPSAGGVIRRFGPVPSGVQPGGSIVVADDCTWLAEGAAFLPDVGSSLYVRPIGVAGTVGDSLDSYGSAWGFVLDLVGKGATAEQVAAAIIVEAPVDLTTNGQHCGQVAALSPAMVAWRTSLTQRIGDWIAVEAIAQNG